MLSCRYCLVTSPYVEFFHVSFLLYQEPMTCNFPVLHEAEYVTGHRAGAE